MKVILFYHCNQNFKEKMLESLAASILNGILGKYIKDLDSSNLNLGILKGEKTDDIYRIRLPSTNKTSKVFIKVLKIGSFWRSNCGNMRSEVHVRAIQRS